MSGFRYKNSDVLALSCRQNFYFPSVPGGAQVRSMCSIKNLVRERSFQSSCPCFSPTPKGKSNYHSRGIPPWGQGTEIASAFLVQKSTMVNKAEILPGLNNAWVYAVILNESFKKKK